jgi:hypothetical protein
MIYVITAADKTITDSSRGNMITALLSKFVGHNLRGYYYLSNVRHDRFALEVRYLLPGYHEFGDVSNYAVSLFFDVRVRLSLSSPCDRNRRVGRREASRGAAAPSATIAAWSLSDGYDDGDEQQGKTTTALIEELGRATFAEEQDCKLVQELIKKANDLTSLMISTALKRPDKFIASLYYEEWNDGSVVDFIFSNHYHDKEEDQFAYDTDDNDYNSLLWNNNNNNNPPEDNNENIHSMLAELAADTNRLFYSKYKKKK